jgi:AcrR family transcriptional regulator
MSSCNAVEPDVSTAADDTENAILDAARECVLACGVRRTSLSDVARRAGVSRPTVYRRWPDLRALVADLMTRELARVFASAGLAGTAGPVRERAVRQLVAVAASLRAHPLLTKIIEVDPETLQPYIFERLGASQRMALGYIAGLIQAGQRDGSVRAGEPDVMASTVLLSVQSAVLSGRLTAGAGTPAQREAELALLIDRYLEPRPGGPA